MVLASTEAEPQRPLGSCVGSVGSIGRDLGNEKKFQGLVTGWDSS